MIITYKTTFFDRFGFMSNSLSNFVNNLSEGLHNNKRKDCNSCLEFIKIEDNQSTFDCLKCNKNHVKHYKHISFL